MRTTIVILVLLFAGSSQQELDYLERFAPVDEVVGTEVAPDEFPAVVFFTAGEKCFCGGTILTTTTVLTAAHCFGGGDFTGVTVNAGTIFRDRPASERQIRSVVVHSGYRNHRKSVKDDIAVVHLTEPLEFSKYVQPVVLWPSGMPVTKNATVCGWGISEMGHGSNRLLKVGLRIMPISQCRETMRRSRISVLSNNICAYGTQNDACNGDSGGPLFARLHDHTPVQVGIVSWGVKHCSTSDSPGIYTRVDKYREWIEESICSPDKSAARNIRAHTVGYMYLLIISVIFT